VQIDSFALSQDTLAGSFDKRDFVSSLPDLLVDKQDHSLNVCQISHRAFCHANNVLFDCGWTLLSSVNARRSNRRRSVLYMPRFQPRRCLFTRPSLVTQVPARCCAAMQRAVVKKWLCERACHGNQRPIDPINAHFGITFLNPQKWPRSRVRLRWNLHWATGTG
jgi:hypothetical protein